MKIIPSILFFIFFSELTLAQDSSIRVRVFAGYRSLTTDYEFKHDTHPDDFFLFNSNVPGSAGTTELNGRLWYLSLGAGGTISSGRNSYNLDFGFLIGNERDIQQNINDSRPPHNAAFIYSEINWGIFAAIAASYKISRVFYIGAEAQLGGVFIESGWDRFNKDQEVETKLELVPTIGPTISFYFIEATVQFGRKVDYGIKATYKF